MGIFKKRSIILKDLNRDKEEWKISLHLKGKQEEILEKIKDIIYINKKKINSNKNVIKRQNEIMRLKNPNKKKKKEVTNIDSDTMKKLQKKYVNYILAKKKLDNVKDIGINFFDSSLDNINNNKNKNKSRILKIIKLFNKENQENNNKTLFITNENIKQNIIEERVRNIESRKVSNNLLNPYYFFTAQYNERSMPSQIKHWASSIYSYVKLGRSENNFLDIYTSKLIKLFFSVKYIKRKLVWDTRLIEGIKVKSTMTLMHDINKIIKYTSYRTSLNIRKVKTYTSLLLTLDWMKKQIQHSKLVSIALRQKKSDFFSGFYAKKKTYIRRLSKVLLSKPLFKHTSFNLVIDLFVYNNKRFKFRKIKNLILRRTSYKYLYSMYADYYNKIKETINRPRFFYTNLIMPSIYNYYKWIILYYEFFMIRKNKSMITYFCLLLLQLNFIKKTKFNSVKNVNKADITFKRLSKKNGNNNILSYFKNSKLTKYYNRGKIKVEKLKKGLNLDDDKLEKKITKIRKSKFLIYKKYMEDLNKKSNKPIDLNSLTLWNIEGMGNSYSTPAGSITKEKKNKKSSGFKYNVYKEREKQNQEIKNVFKEKISYKKKIQKIKKLKAENIKKFMNKFNLTSHSELSLFNKNKTMTDQEERKLLRLDEFIKEKYDYFNNNSNKMKKNYFYRKNKNMNINNELNINKNFNNTVTQDSLGTVLKNNDNIQNNIDNVSDYINIQNKNDNNNENNIDKNNNIIDYDKSSLNKDEYIMEIYRNNNNMKKTIDNIFTSFYFNNINEKDSYNMNDKIISNGIHYDYNKKYNNSILRNNIQDKLNNTKILWDNLDYSIFRILSKYLKLKDKSLDIQSSNLNSVFSEINKLKGYGNIWYVLYFLGVLKKEYSKISRDVLYRKEFQVLPYSNKLMDPTYYLNPNLNNYNISYEYYDENMDINFWPAFYENKREDSLKMNMGYNEKLFKPYYRDFIPYLILKIYKRFISYISIKNWIPEVNSNNYIFNKINEFSNNNLMLYKYLTVKILLDLLHYNYRSLIKIKSKYYYISKFRSFRSKLNRLYLNNWLTSVRFLRRLRKTPTNYWFRYHKLASYYLKKIIRYGELDTNRKVLVPFVLYFEDVLFNIYGKWVLIRLWPLKRYYLSSFILVGRVLTLLLWRKKRKSEWLNFRKVTFRLIGGIKILQIKKAYDFYMKNSSSWPEKLINIMKDRKTPNHLNYNNLEYYREKDDRYLYLNSYLIENNQLYSYISTIYSNTITGFNNNINLLKKSLTSFTKKKNILINNKIHKRKSSRLIKQQFIYKWLKPLKNNLMKLNQYTDISGIKIRINGRVGLRRNNLRSLHKTKFYGNFFGFRHSTQKLKKPKMYYSPKLRGYLRPHIDYAIKLSKTMNGAVSFKVWLSSDISADIHELLLHLVRIKYIYNELINRYYIVDPKLKVINYKFGELNNDILINKLM